MAENFELFLQDFKMISPRVRHLSFVRADNVPVNFIAGQFISLHIQKQDKELLRNYSIANSPLITNTIEIACAYLENGLASELLFNLKPGDKVKASGAYGRFHLREEPVERYLLIATGTGVTPYRAMLNELELKLQTSDLEVVLIMGGRSHEEIIYQEDFLALAKKYPKFKYLVCYSRQLPNEPLDYHYTGRVQEVFKLLNITPERDIAYLCGHPDMVDTCFTMLQDLGIDKKNIRREKYVFGVQI